VPFSLKGMTWQHMMPESGGETERHFVVLIEHDEDGYYVAAAPSLRG
jgi:hypothetical protein